MPLFVPSRILRAAAHKSTTIKWSETLNLPQSAFPARPSPAQLQQYRIRCTDDLYVWQRANRPRARPDGEGEATDNEFVLHDGPPYANGAVHVGHALNKILKDLIIRWQLSIGKRVHYKPGWDCHGLPIELRALQAQKTQMHPSRALKDAPKQEEAVAPGMGMSGLEIRQVARELATATVETQKESFRQWGVMGDWDAPYKTMDLGFELGQLRVFREMVRRGLVSRHHRPVYWSPSSRTALAEAELEYDDNHKCMAAFVKMPIVVLPACLASHPDVSHGNISALIWTTTPWTLPANKAVAVNPDLQYTLLSLNSSSSATSDAQQLLIARDRVQHVLSFLSKDTSVTTVVNNVSGSELADGQAACFNIFSGTQSPILKADYVTATSGTGLVHTAPGHGMEDYQLCQENGIGTAFAPVDDEGRFTADAFSHGDNAARLTGMQVESEGAQAVLAILAKPEQHVPSGLHQGGGTLVLATHHFTHKNPIDWRTKQPVIVRATAQWFADVSAIKDRALAALDNVQFIPDGGKARLTSFVDGRSQWCVSRQRAWGVPIPALYHKDTSQACISEDSIDHIIHTIQERGTDAWFSDRPDDPVWLHSSLEPGMWVRGKDTMDVWFDSGTTWTTLANKRADVYLEGTDQHRGWFQSSLLTAIATQDPNKGSSAPFRLLITHGFTLDAEGRKMSKSIGNVISPDQIMDGSLLPPLKVRKQRGKRKSDEATAAEGPQYDVLGPDALRLWVASSDYTRDVSISVPVLQSVQQALQKYRVTFKFLLGVLGDYEPEPAMSLDTTFADRAVLHRLNATTNAVYDACNEHKFHRAMTEINNFVNADLSSFYFEIIKDAMYTGSVAVRRRTQAVLARILEDMLRMLGTICPLLVEEVWAFMPAGLRDGKEHPLHRIWHRPQHPILPKEATENLEDKFAAFKRLSAAVKLAQEEARVAGKVGSGLACAVKIYAPRGSVLAPHIQQLLESGELADLLVVSGVTMHEEDHPGQDSGWTFTQTVEDVGSPLHVAVVPPTMEKCVRCWKYTAQKEGEVCKRCADVVREKGFG